LVRATFHAFERSTAKLGDTDPIRHWSGDAHGTWNID
jgi:hypothetical protein